MKKTIIGVFAIISAFTMLTSCGQVDVDTESKVTTSTTTTVATEGTSVTTSTPETTTTAELTTTTVTTEDEESGAVTTSIVVVTGKDGKVSTSFAVDSNGNIISDRKIEKTTTTATTTKKTTTTTKSGGNSSSSGGNSGNNGNSGNGGWSGGNSGNGNSDGNGGQGYVEPVQTEAQTQPVTTTTTQAPATTTTQATTTQAPQPSGDNVTIDTAEGLTDLDRAYLHLYNADELNSYQWELIRSDMCDYFMDKFNGKQTVTYYEERYISIDEMESGARLPTNTVTFPSPLKLLVNTSWTDFSHAHIDVGKSVNVIGSMDCVYVSKLSKVHTSEEFQKYSKLFRHQMLQLMDFAIETWYYLNKDVWGGWDDPRFAEAISTLEFNVGYVDSGQYPGSTGKSVYFLTE